MANTWQTPLRTTVARLAAHGVPFPSPPGDLVDGYLEFLLPYKQAGKLLDESRQDRLFTRPDAEFIVGRLTKGSPLRQVPRAHREVLQSLVSSHSLLDVLQRLPRPARKPVTEDPAAKDNPKRPRQRRIDAERESLLVPFYSLPGKLEGLLVYNRHATRSTLPRPSFKFLRDSRRATHEAGATGCHEIWHPSVRRIYACSSLGDYLRLHLMHLRIYNHTLPLIFWLPEISKGSSCWPTYAGRELVFFSSQLDDVQSLTQAILADAMVAVQTRPASRAASLPEDPLTMLEKQVWQPARHWTEWLDNYCRTASDQQVDALVSYLLARQLSLSSLMSRCTPATRDRIHRLRPQEAKTVRGRRCQVTEVDNQLYVAGNNRQVELAANFTFRLDHLVRYDNSTETKVVGRVLHGEQSAPFSYSYEQFNRHPLRHCARTMIESGLGAPLFNTTYQHDLLNLVTLIQPPKLIVGIPRVGWDHKRACFHFPGFSIAMGGGYSLQTDNRDKELPCHTLQIPPQTRRQELRFLALNTRPNRAFWGCLIHLWTTAIGDILDKPCPPLYVQSNLRRAVEVLAETLGTRGYNSQQRHPHAVPLYVDKWAPLKRPAANSFWAVLPGKYVIRTAMSDRAVCLVEDGQMVGQHFANFASKLATVSFLDYVLTRKLVDFESDEIGLHQAVTQAVRDWLKSLKLPLDGFEQSVDQLYFPRQHYLLQCRLIRQAAESLGNWLVPTADHVELNKRTWCFRPATKRWIFVSEGLWSAWSMRRARPRDTASQLQTLHEIWRDCPGYIKSDTIWKTPGWKFDYDWWVDNIQPNPEGNRTSLRVVG